MHINKKYKNQICCTEAILYILQKVSAFLNSQTTIIFSTLLAFASQLQSIVSSVQRQSIYTNLRSHRREIYSTKTQSGYYCYWVALYIVTDLHCISKAYKKKLAANMHIETEQVCWSSLEVSRSCTTDGTSTFYLASKFLQNKTSSSISTGFQLKASSSWQCLTWIQ